MRRKYTDDPQTPKVTYSSIVFWISIQTSIPCKYVSIQTNILKKGNKIQINFRAKKPNLDWVWLVVRWYREVMFKLRVILFSLLFFFTGNLGLEICLTSKPVFIKRYSSHKGVKNLFQPHRTERTQLPKREFSASHKACMLSTLRAGGQNSGPQKAISGVNRTNTNEV